MDLRMRDFERTRVGQLGVEAWGCVLTETFEKLPDHGRPIAHPHPWCVGVLGSPRPRQHLLLSVSWVLAVLVG